MSRALSREERIGEILRCGKDPTYFIKEYVMIQHPKKGLIPFVLFDFQEEVVKALEQNRFNIVLKSRQLGLSTLSAAYAVWLAIFHKDKSILVIATKLETAINFIKKVKVALQNLPPWLLLPSHEDNKRSVTFNNGSQIIAVPTSDDAGRSEALSLLIVDEAAFIKNFEDIWTGLYPTLTTGGNAMVISTPNGVGGMYYRLWTEAAAGQNEFHSIRLPWWIHPEHDQAWFDLETKNMPRRKVTQEYLCDFLSSGDTFLQPADLEALRDTIRDPIERLGHDHNTWVWKHPEPGRRYIISADVARGDAGDYSAFHVIDFDSCEVVAEYMGKVPPEKLAVMLLEQGKRYNDAVLCPENNTFGYFTCVKLRDEGYQRLYYPHLRGDPFGYRQVDPDALPGFSTQAKTRVQILAKLEELIRNRRLSVYSQRLYDQLLAFVWNGAKPGAVKDSHDDLIMSVAIGAWLVGGGVVDSEQAAAQAIAVIRASSVERRHNGNLPGGIDNVGPPRNASIMGQAAALYTRPRDPSQVKVDEATDFSWLLH